MDTKWQRVIAAGFVTLAGIIVAGMALSNPDSFF